ncbi:cytochrome ubiquinol oxidase subunit I, partial [Mesorhizobium sp. M4B.F.Ca.ET.190.01.1.1]
MSSADLTSERDLPSEREASAKGDIAPEHDGPRDTGMDDASLHHWLTRTWRTPPGIIGALSSVDHKVIARRYLITAFLFLCLGGLNVVV